jgi:hypothetical protein
MSSLELKLDLPDTLAREAEAGGLLTPEAIEALLRAEIRRRRVNKLFATADQLADLATPLTEAEIEAEIKAVRQARRPADANRS